MDILSTIQRIRQGEIDLYREVIIAFEGEVQGVAAYFLGDRMATRDLVQETFVRAYQHLDRFDVTRGNFGVWLRGIARHVVQDEVRQRARERARLGFYWEYLSCQPSDLARGSESEDAMRAHLRICTSQLEGDAARILDMRYGQDLTMEEISEQLGRTLHAARKFLSRVRMMLRDCVEERLLSA